RLFYVALTRAKERVFLTNAESRFMYGHYQHNSDSEFLREIHDELIDRQGLAKKKTTIYEGIRRKPEPVTVTPEVAEYQKVNNQLSIGDKITHQVFGSGVVVMIDKDKATIAFQAPIGIKTLMKDHPSIKKG
ncbi:MAG: hypothetical protein U1C51_02360, partial [Candidatus Izemoplasmatales bacterium]|nr:hypothetical protein [Candidatus Izemoplasmatales bacterium]